MAMHGFVAKYVSQWRDTLERAIGFDSWGQVVEAMEAYERLAADIRRALTAPNARSVFSGEQVCIVPHAPTNGSS